MVVLRVDLRALAAGAVETRRDIAPTDPELADLEFHLSDRVRVSGRLMESGPGSYYWDARLQTTVTVPCRRCLEPVEVKIDEKVRVLFAEEETADPSTYVIPDYAGELELGEAIREELILAAPEFVLCREDCRGLCARCGKNLNTGPCDCRPEPDPRWLALEVLKARPDTDTE